MMTEPSRRGSSQTEHGSVVSTLPQVEHTRTLSTASLIAEASGDSSCSFFLMRCSAARRAERGPSPGTLASSWIRRSISGPTIRLDMALHVGFFCGKWNLGELGHTAWRQKRKRIDESRSLRAVWPAAACAECGRPDADPSRRGHQSGSDRALPQRLAWLDGARSRYHAAACAGS